MAEFDGFDELFMWKFADSDEEFDDSEFVDE